MDELGFVAATLPVAIARDVANAQYLRSKSGLPAYEEGLFARLAREDIARTPTGQKLTFNEVVAMWVAEKIEGLRDDEMGERNIRDAKDCVKEAKELFGTKIVSEITQADVLMVLSKFKGKLRRRNVRVRIKEVFKYCQDHLILGSAPNLNPCTGIKPPKIDERFPDPISVDDARKLLALAVQTEAELGCTTWVTFRMFAALRDAEASKVVYGGIQGINLARGFIHLTKKVAKKRERMVFFDADKCPDPKLKAFIPANLKVILAELPIRTDGCLAPPRRNLDRFKAYARHCGIEWKANALRAGFATHHFALFQDAATASRMMGHLATDGGVEVFYNHYYKYADYQAGKAYFEIGMAGLKAAAAAYTPPMSLAAFVATLSRKHTRARVKTMKAAA
jgi:site-specific recombinase XerC